MGPSLAALDEISLAARGSSRLGKMMRGKGVRASEEFRRIDSLPRRVWDPERALALAAEMTALLRTPTGTRSLKPTQAIALLELALYAGGLCPMRAGAGKSLVTYLAPYVMGAERPVLLVPAKLREKTKQEMITWAQHFRVAYWMIVKSYEEISRVSHAKYLEDLRCDLLLCDEGHKLKNSRAAVTRRVRRHVEHSACRVVVLSGTVTKRKIEDYAHLAKWSLDEGSPIPRGFADTEEWGNALDENPRSLFRTQPGALTLWSKGNDSLDAVRKGFQERVTQTPGVIATYDTLTDCSLVISRLQTPECPQILEAFTKLRDAWETPDGWRLVDGLAIARAAKEMALGFYYRWEPRGPDAWMKARSEWGKFVRYVLANNRSGLDSALQVTQAYPHLAVGKICEKIEITSQDPLSAWRAQEPLFKPNSVPVWISDVPLLRCAKWLQESQPGIVWCEHVAFAEMLSEATGVPYAGQGGMTEDGRTIESLAGQHVIASRASSGEGRNLQDGWARNLFTSPMAMGADWEQTLARTHRDGQLEDEVTAEILVGCLENELSWAQALRDAKYIGDTSGQEQRLQYATILWDRPTLTGPVWQKE